VTFENYHTFARGYLRSRGKMGYDWIAQEPERERFLALAVAAVRKRAIGRPLALLDGPLRFFSEEIRYIAQHGLSDDEYRTIERAGRGAGFPRALRPTLLDVRNEYIGVRAAAGRRYDWDDVAGAVAAELAIDEAPRRYRHVVIDEGQDFSPQMLRSLTAAIPPDGSLTFFGDMAQQIYGRQVSWRQAGLHVPHGIWEFKRNYRNTPEIAELGLAIADMDYFRDVPDMVRPDEFEPSGPLPSLISCSTTDQETRFVIEAARDAARAGSVGVLMRRHQDEARFGSAFRGGQHLHRGMHIWDPGPGISWGTVHAAKGYEFDTVFLVGLSHGGWPEPEAIIGDGEEAARASDGRLLYVAVTRARQELNMSYVGRPTTLLPAQGKLWQDQAL
jgi:superfamily I DNA/RNA helicase